MESKKHYEVRGPGSRFACCPTTSETQAIIAWANARYDGSEIDWRVYVIEDGVERTYGSPEFYEEFGQ